MSNESSVFQELDDLLSDLQTDHPGWEEREVITQLRLSIPEYAHGIWRVALPLSNDECLLHEGHRSRFDALRQRALVEEDLDLAHVITSIDVKQSLDIIRDVYAGWAGDLGSHILANFARQTEKEVGSPDSMAGLADIQGDLDGDNIAQNMREGRPITAIRAYYSGDQSGMNGVTVHSRYRTFAQSMGLLDAAGEFSVDPARARRVFRDRTREFVELDELSLGMRHPLRLLKKLFDEDEQAQIDALLNTALDQFLALIASGMAQEQLADQS